MAKAKKLPSGNYRVLASKTVNGEIIRKSFTAETKKAAELSALEWQNSNDTTNLKTTLANACKFYINSRRNIVSPVTVKTYEGYTKRYLQELMPLPLQNLSNFAIQTAFNELSGTLSAKTVKSIHGFFRSVLLQYKIDIDVTLPKVQKPKYNTPDIDTCKKILELVQDTDLQVPVNLAMRCGLRLSEVCGLKFANVYNNYIYIDNVRIVFNSEVIEKAPKSIAGVRKIPLPEDIKKMIDNLPHDTEYIENRKANTLSIAFQRFLINNNLPKIKFHELRHAFASVMALAGVPERYAMSIGGWDTADILHKIYEQTFEDKQQEFATQIDKFFA